MLIELFGKNFRCFRDEFRLSLLATDIDRQSDRGIVRVEVEGDDEPLALLRCVAIYGPNASGKSTVLDAAAALRHLILKSHQFESDKLLDPYEPFALGTERGEPVTLGAKAVLGGAVYEYGVMFDRSSVQREWLLRLGPADDETLIDRTGQGVSGAWVQDDRFALITKDFRPNALLLSLADSLAPGLARHIAVDLRRFLGDGVPDKLFGWGSGSEWAASRAQRDRRFHDWLLAQLRSADVGVVDLQVEEEEPRSLMQLVEYIAALRANSDEFSGRQAQVLYRLALLHGGEEGPVPLPFERESHGTRRLVEMAPWLYFLAHGEYLRAYFVDELDASMHPVLLDGIVRNFNCGVDPDKVRGQLVFTAHETSLMDDEAKWSVLRRDQVYFTEKESSGAARLYSLAEFRERNNLNIRRRYLQGRYGALPALGNAE
jgi:uncharacterized protein